MKPAMIHPSARESPPTVTLTLGPYLSWMRPPGIMHAQNTNPHKEYAHVAWESDMYVQPAFIPPMTDPAIWSLLANSAAFQTLHAYRMPRQRFTETPARTVIHPSTGTFSHGPAFEPALPCGESVSIFFSLVWFRVFPVPHFPKWVRDLQTRTCLSLLILG